MKTILGRIRNTQPNAARPNLELYFHREDADCLPPTHRGEVHVEIDGVRWQGTIGLKPGNPPYLHAELRNGASLRRCTDVFDAAGLAAGAVVRFRVSTRSFLDLDTIDCQGSWRPEIATRSAVAAAPRASRTAPEAIDERGSFPFADRQAVLALADRYWALIPPPVRAEELRFEQEMPLHRAQRCVDKSMFVRLARWKSPRKTPDYEKNTENEVRVATRNAMDAASDDDAIRALTRLDGVATRTATALLHWLVPDRYPILDFRVLSSLGWPTPWRFESPELYAHVSRRVQHHAQGLGLDLRTLDRALWAWDKQRTK